MTEYYMLGTLFCFHLLAYLSLLTIFAISPVLETRKLGPGEVWSLAHTHLLSKLGSQDPHPAVLASRHCTVGARC